MALVALVVAMVAAPAAHAGTWMQVSCVNPDGSAAPSEGWTKSASGPSDPWGVANTQCSPGTPMVAELADLSAAPPDTVQYLTYQPPAGSTLSGGSVNVNLSADGYGPSTGQPTAAAFARLYEPTLQTTFFQCVAFFQTCGPRPDFSGVVNLPGDAQGQLIASAGCYSNNGASSCDTNANNNVWAMIQIVWAHLLLSSSVSPAGSGFSGSALERRVHGTAHLVFTASEPAGPGIYAVSVAIDGTPVSTASPTNGGACVPVGTDPATGALMFDVQQPCLTSENVDVSVPTSHLSDGSHGLAVTVTDAAHNSSTVLDQNITTSNPQTTPRPSGHRALHAQFTISWRWSGPTTLLRSIRVKHLLRNARVTVRCAGKHCPRLRTSATGPRKISAMLAHLAGRRLTAGQSLLITVTAPRHRPERIALGIRNGRKPTARLLKG